MKSTVTASLLVALASTGALAHAGGSTLSEISTLGAASVVTGSVILVASPFIVISKAVTGSAANRTHVDLQVTNDKGHTETIKLPKETVAKAGLKEGDKLKVTPNKTGALLSKGDQPVAYLVTPENAQLTRSRELAR
jgi:hypothetical protein